MKLSPTMRGVARMRNAREARHLGEIEAFTLAKDEAEEHGSVEDVNRVLMMGSFRLARFDGRRQLNVRIKRLRRERDLLIRDLRRGHNTARVKRAVARHFTPVTLTKDNP